MLRDFCYNCKSSYQAFSNACPQFICSLFIAICLLTSPYCHSCSGLGAFGGLGGGGGVFTLLTIGGGGGGGGGSCGSWPYLASASRMPSSVSAYFSASPFFFLMTTVSFFQWIPFTDGLRDRKSVYSFGKAGGGGGAGGSGGGGISVISTTGGGGGGGGAFFFV